MKTIVSIAFKLALLVPLVGEAASVSIHWFNEASIGTELKDNSGVPLTMGAVASGDGAVLQLGYYSGASQINPFAGSWVPLTGPGTSISTTIGDNPSLMPGRFNITTGFKSEYPNVPPIGTPLAIRFYDSTSLATANYFNTVSNTAGTWNWITSDPTAAMSLAIVLSSPTQVWQDGADSAFRTTIPVPEPSVLWLMAGSAWLVFRRRRDGPR